MDLITIENNRKKFQLKIVRQMQRTKETLISVWAEEFYRGSLSNKGRADARHAAELKFSREINELDLCEIDDYIDEISGE